MLHVEYELEEAMREPVIQPLNRLTEWGKMLKHDQLETTVASGERVL